MILHVLRQPPLWRQVYDVVATEMTGVTTDTIAQRLNVDRIRVSHELKHLYGEGHVDFDKGFWTVG